MSNSPVTTISARKRGTTRFLTGSTPSTCRASSSSRILRAPRSAVIAVPATPATTTAVTIGAIHRTAVRTKEAAEPVERAEDLQRAGRLQARRAEVEREGRDEQRQPAEAQGEVDLLDQ